MVYHLKITCLNPEKPKRSDIEPIFSFNRMFNETEIKYWPIEFEMAGLICVIRRVRHIIDATKQTTVLFTDHAANTSIIKQTIFASGNIDKSNFRLIQAFI